MPQAATEGENGLPHQSADWFAMTKTEAAEEELPQSAPPTAPSEREPETADDELFTRLLEDYKNRLPVHLRGFIGMAKGQLADGVLTVYCATEQQKHLLEAPDAARAIAEVTAGAAERPVTVRFTVGEPAGAAHDRMRDLLQAGGKFDGFTVT